MSDAEQLLQEMTEVIVREVDPERIVLFGSWARGEAGPDSDVDLLVVSSVPYGPGRSRRGEAARLYRRLAGSGVAKDLVLASCDEVEQWRATPGHVVARALREGRVVYERP